MRIMNRWTIVVLLVAVGLVMSVHARKPRKFDLEMTKLAAMETSKGDKMQRGVNEEPLCNGKPCEGPIHLVWRSSGDCTGPPTEVTQVYPTGFKNGTCTQEDAPHSSTEEYDETRRISTVYFSEPLCTGQPLWRQITYFRQCINMGTNMSNAMVFAASDVGNIRPPPRTDGRAKEGPLLSPEHYVPTSCTPNVNCTNDFIRVEHSNHGSCTGSIGEAGAQLGYVHGVCYLQAYNQEFNKRWSCYNSEVLEETFAYGCEGTPLWSVSDRHDKCASTSSLAVGPCWEGVRMACRNPVDSPAPFFPESPACPSSTGIRASISPALFLLALVALLPFVLP